MKLLRGIPDSNQDYLILGSSNPGMKIDPYFYGKGMSQEINQVTSKPTFTKNNRVQLVQGGRPYFDLLLKLIDQARATIHLQYYIFDADVTGNLVIQHLIEAARRGVNIYILIDGYASQKFSKPVIEQLKKEGIHFRFFEALVKSKYFYFGRRLHHKIFVVDTLRVIVGGLNISDKYNDLPGRAAWLDFALFVEGEVAKEICLLCWKSWFAFQRPRGLMPCDFTQVVPEVPKEVKSAVSMRRNDWVRSKNQISKTYDEMFKTAKSEITILSSYFLPGTKVRKAMVKAALRGVKIRVIAAGNSDVQIIKHAERWLYDWMLRNHIELYEYQKNILHGKLGTSDGEWFTLGSYNINDLSAYASIELNLAVINPTLTREINVLLDNIMERDCIHITPERLKKTKNIFIQLMRWTAYKLSRIVFYLFTFYFIQKK